MLTSLFVSWLYDMNAILVVFDLVKKSYILSASPTAKSIYQIPFSESRDNFDNPPGGLVTSGRIHLYCNTKL